MKKIYSAVLGIVMVVMMAAGAGAFEIGENRLENSGFEAGGVGVAPPKWELRIVG